MLILSLLRSLILAAPGILGERLPTEQAYTFEDELHLLQLSQQFNVRASHQRQSRNVMREMMSGSGSDPATKSTLHCQAKMATPNLEDGDPAEVSMVQHMHRRARGKARETSQIIDGELVGRCQFPWMAFIYVDRSTSKNIQGTCSGTLISKQHLLTAAHCFYLGGSDKRFDWPSVLNGSWIKVDATYNATKENSGQINFIESVSLPHADSWYEISSGVGLSEGDIAVVKLKDPLPDNSCISAICIPDKDYIQEGAGWYVAGYGSSSHSLHRGKFKITDPRSWSRVRGVPLRELDMFSASGASSERSGNDLHGHSRIEPGDSGGPFMVRDGDQIFVAGTVSGFALSWKSLSWQVVYTDVFRYREWIASAMENPEMSPGGSAAAGHASSLKF